MSSKTHGRRVVLQLQHKIAEHLALAAVLGRSSGGAGTVATIGGRATVCTRGASMDAEIVAHYMMRVMNQFKRRGN